MREKTVELNNQGVGIVIEKEQEEDKGAIDRLRKQLRKMNINIEKEMNSTKKIGREKMNL